jgi:hypothetical protein
MLKEEEINKFKADKRVGINLSLLGICFSLFTFIVAINSKILQNNFILAVELTIAIPFFLSSVFARTKLAYTKKPKMWDSFGFIAFTIGYSFLISVVGILLSSLVSIKVGMIFFALNLIMAFSYSTLEVIENREKLMGRLKKDLFFLVMIVVFGILPSLGVWNL